jgi:hypothetical protein
MNPLHSDSPPPFRNQVLGPDRAATGVKLVYVVMTGCLF